MLKLLTVLGVDASLAHILLNNGLSGTDKDKVAMINYLAASGGISPDILPLVLKVDNGKDYYLQSLIGSVSKIRIAFIYYFSKNSILL